MAEYIPDLVIPSDQYVSINTLSGISVGTTMEIQLKTNDWVRLIESATQPANNVTDGIIISSMYHNYATATIKALSLEIWAITITSTYDRVSKVNVQEV
jgi:hypothetical protein